MSIQKVVVIGGGTMGLDIAQVFAKTGHDVIVRDIKDEIITASEARLNKGLDKLVAKGKLDDAGKKAITDKISFTTDLGKAADADLVVEAAIENLDIKKSIFAELDAICKPECILASNTSSISLTEIASATRRPDKVIGMHFFNPAPVMKLLEVVKGYSTSQETIDVIMAIGEKMNKVTILAQDKAGFIVNRVLDPMLNEAIFLLEEGVGTAEDIDNGMKFGCNHPMGPLALTDLIGLDVLLAVMEVLYRETADSKYRPAPLLKKMVRAGKLGKKTGEGFFKY